MATKSNTSLRRGTTPASLSISSSNLASSSTSNLLDPLHNAGGPSHGGTATGSAAGTGPSPHVKVTISLEEWERKAPLSENQIRSVNMLAKINEARKSAVPLKFAEEPGTPTHGISASTTHAQRLLQAQGSSPSTPSTPGTRTQTPTHTHPHTPKPEHTLLHPQHPVQTPQQFYDWFAMIDRSVAHSQEASYRAHVASLEEHLQACDLLVNRIEEIDREVDGMMEGWRGVEESGKSLKGACERLLEERDALIELVDDIGDHLEYFQELEHATRMLNHPGESLIFQPDFLYMVERVDICIDFLRNHRHYREAEVYLLRFQQCMTRAMTLIKMNFVGSLRALSSEISKRLSEKEISTTAQHHLLYTRFKTLSSHLAPLLGELERRSQSYPDTLSSLLQECHSAYLSTRKALLVPRVMEEIRGLDPGRSELVQLTRDGCGYLKGLCVDEWGLYREFFRTGEAGVYQYLESLCDLLYDDLRPRILHEPRLTVLCEVCTVLQALMVLDASSSSPTLSSSEEADDSSSSEEESSEEDSETESTTQKLQVRSKRRRTRTSQADDQLTMPAPLSPTPSTTHSQKPNTARLGRRLHIAHLLKMVLQDAQTKLFFKAQAVIQSEIRYYVPKEEDLDMGFGAAPRTSGTELREKESTNQLFQNVYALAKRQGGVGRGGQETWYPTLRKTVWVLGQLKDFVKPAIFEDIAQEALSYCRLSLIAASELITARGANSITTTSNSGTTAPSASYNAKLDGALFLVRHLLILKEVWASLEEMRVAEDEEAVGGGVSKDRDGRKSALWSARALELGGGGLMSAVGGMGPSASGGAVGGVTETLTNMLNKTTSLLPEGLFASLGVTRGMGGESDMRGVKLDIDHSLRKACEDVIAACANPLCDPLDAWTASVTPQRSDAAGLSATAAIAPAPATATTIPQAEVSTIHLRFLESIQRDLALSVARVRAYLVGNADANADANGNGNGSEDAEQNKEGDERTVQILLDHVVDRILGSYERWDEAVRRSGRSADGVEVLSSARLKEMLRVVSGDTPGFGGYVGSEKA